MVNLTSVLVQLREERMQAQQQVEKLDEAIAVIQELLGRNGSARIGRRGKRTMSAAGRRKIAAAQRARWARVRSQKQVKTSGQKRHWSQLPENKARVLLLVKRMNRARLAAQRVMSAAVRRKDRGSEA
jgi:hypothetical protein